MSLIYCWFSFWIFRGNTRCFIFLLLRWDREMQCFHERWLSVMPRLSNCVLCCRISSSVANSIVNRFTNAIQYLSFYLFHWAFSGCRKIFNISAPFPPLANSAMMRRWGRGYAEAKKIKSLTLHTYARLFLRTSWRDWSSYSVMQCSGLSLPSEVQCVETISKSLIRLGLVMLTDGLSVVKDSSLQV